MITISNLSKSYKGKKVVDALSFTMKEGQLFALLGSNGAGKSTTIKMILNLVKRDEGEIMILYPANAFSLTYNFDLDSIFVFSSNIGRNAGIVLLMLLSADVFLVSFYVSRKIHRPLQNLVMGMKRVAQGEEKVELSMQTEKEFVEIQEAFNHMTEELYDQKAENERMSKNRQRMLLELSHDIKTPVATIRSYAFALQEGLVDETELDQYYRTIALKADRVDTMAADLFTMLKMESADYALELKKTDLAELTRRICAEFYEELIGAGFEFVIEIPEQAIYVNADEKLLSEYIFNIFALVRSDNYNDYDIPNDERCIIGER